MVVEGKVEGTKEMNGWNLASNPPDGNPGLWTREVIVFTNLGNCYSNICFFHGTYKKEDGIWQRPRSFIKGEYIEFWIDEPDYKKT